MLGVGARPEEITAARPGDDLIARADVVMDRGFELDAPPEQAWPWLVQLGKRRAGWYLPRTVERFIPRSRRALRQIDPAWQGLEVGDIIPDYGGSDASFEVAEIAAPTTLVYLSQRGAVGVSWAITLTPEGSGSRVHLRLRLGPVKHRRLAESVGGLFDLLTIAGMAAGLRERVS